MALTVDHFREAAHELLPMARSAAVPLTPDQAELLADRQVQVTCRLAPLANLLHLASIVMTGLFFIPSSTGWFRPAWTGAMVLLGLNSVRWWLPRSQATYDRGRRDLWGLRAEAATWSVLNGILAWKALPVADPRQQLLLVATIAGVIGAGAMALSTERTVGFTWLWGHVLTIGTAFVATGQPTLRLLTVQLVVYGAALSLAILYLSVTFELRCRAEMAADAEREVVTLLLDDVEGGARDWLWEAQPDGALVGVSNRFAARTGRPVHRVEGRSLPDLLAELGAADHRDGRAPFDALVAALAADRAFRDLVVPVLVEGVRSWWSISGHPTPVGAGPSGWRGVCSDVTEGHRHQREVLRLATIDTLTGLPNRHRFHEALAARAATASADRRLVLAIVDLDNFKIVNDTLGHPVGDGLLRAVAQRLRHDLTADEECFRLGGDEFAILLDETGGASALARLGSFLDVLHDPFSVEGNRLEVTGCLGHAALPGDAAEPDELVRLADLALYAAKGAGPGVVRRFDRGLGERMAARALALHDLGRAIDQEQFALWYQPQIDLATGRVLGFEALLRWHHPARGLVAPGAFIDVAEETGLIVPIGAWAARRALADARSWPEPLRVAINLSPTQLVSAGFVDGFTRVLAASGVDPGRVELEVTESGVVDRHAQAALEAVRATGVALAIDDFGTGYSSFATLRALPVDTVKIDRAFVAQLDPTPGHASQVVVRAIIEVARALALGCVAEGVETVEQAALLRALGCPTAQGYLYARPMPAAQVAAYVAEATGSTQPPTSAARRSASTGPMVPPS
ncbi:putative bifunctional diguanylate cyclase/phosphodiesterase [Aquihabitans sp. McL0605]|uniref:putative bifunctional diguanylate cyclase/phosphodiesterase n=1 Tax=Aquihabitans sp. McL0605 TaxID=3415671 RepID=UPI003CE713BD